MTVMKDIASPGWVEMRCLVSKLRSPHSQERQATQAAWKLANMATSADNHAMIVAEGGIQAFVKLLKIGPRTCRASAVRAIACMAQGSEFRRSIIHAGAVPCLVRILRGGGGNERLDVLRALASLIEGPVVGRGAALHGALETVAGLLGNEDPDIRFQALRILSDISADEDFREEAGAVAAIGHAVSLLSRGPGEESSLMALGYLANVTCGKECRKKVLAARAVPALVGIVDSHRGKAKSAAVRILANLAEAEEAREMMVSEGAVQPLVDALSDWTCVCEAIRCLANLSCREETCTAIVKNGGVPELVNQLCSKSSVVAGYTPFALANISENPKYCVRITEAGAVGPLLALVRRRTATSRLSVLRALCNLSRVAENKKVIGKPESLWEIARLLHSGCERTVGVAAGLLANLAEYEPNRQTIMESGAMGSLVQLLSGRRQGRCKLNAAIALANLSADKNSRACLPQMDVVKPLVGLCRDGTDLMKVHAARALHNLACSPDVQRSIAWEGGIPPLVDMLSSRSNAVREQALHALVRLGLTPEHWAVIKNQGGVLPLAVQLVVSEFKDVRFVVTHMMRFCNRVCRALVVGHWR